MTRSDPPPLATWLLKYFGFLTADQALLGDLVEEYHRRDSAAWYWRQVIGTMFIGFQREVRRHRLLTIRSVGIGLMVNYWANFWFHDELVSINNSQILHVASHPFLATAATAFLAGALSGVAVGLLHRKNRNAMLFAFLGALMVWAPLAHFNVSSPVTVAAPFAVTYYASVLAGAVVGGFVLSPEGSVGAPRGQTH